MNEDEEKNREKELEFSSNWLVSGRKKKMMMNKGIAIEKDINN
jgi:hypothetical protein